MIAKRRLLKATITHISLVAKGANAKTIIWKSDDNPVHSKVIAIVKTDDEQRMVYGIVYSPEQVDTQGDVASAQVIKSAAYDFMRAGFATNVDKQHNFVAGDGFVAESWLVRKGDPLFASEPVDSWAVGIKIEKDETWNAIKKGEITGISMAGEAQVQAVEQEEKIEKTMLEKFAEWLGIKKDFNANMQQVKIRESIWALQDAIRQIQDTPDLTEQQKKANILASIDQFKEYVSSGAIIKKEDTEMTPEEITKAVQTAVEAAVKPVADRLEKLEKAETPAAPEKPELDTTIQAAIEKAMKPIADRIEVLEKATPGTQLAKGQQAPAKGSDGLSLV